MLESLCHTYAKKGDIVKIFRTDTGEQLLSDGGIIGVTSQGRVLTSQWSDPSCNFTSKEHGFAVSGPLHFVPTNTIFMLMKMILFRSFLIKGLIRNLSILTSRSSCAYFYRAVEWRDGSLTVTDKVKITDKTQFSSLRFSDEFLIRYVPQSRYSKLQELSARWRFLNEDHLKILNGEGKIYLERTLDLMTGKESSPKVIPIITGTMGIEYSEGRKKKLSLTYRLQRRADEVIRAIRAHHASSKTLLDLGPAEGKVLSKIQDAFPGMKCTGLEFSQELIDICTDKRLTMIQGDAMRPPFPAQSFDVVTASALIEHVDDPRAMLCEVHRVLCPGGVVIITTPDPFFERVATAIGHLPDELHQETMTLFTLRRYLAATGFEPVQLEKFMMSPWGFPGELLIERLMKTSHMGGMLLNQLVVGKKL